MNIWLINHYANPPDEMGDARHYSHARELIRRGHNVEIIASSFHHLKRRQIGSAEGKLHASTAPGKPSREVRSGVPFIWIGSRSYGSGSGTSTSSAGRVLGMFEFAWRVCQGHRKGGWAYDLQRPDLILGSSPHPFAALAAERLAHHYGVPFVLEMRDAWPYVLTEVGGYSKRHPFVMLVDRTMRYLYRRAARIVMFSRDSTELLREYGADPRKILWIAHGVDLSMAAHFRPPPDDGVFTVTYIGAHNQWNSLDAILDAARLIQQGSQPQAPERAPSSSVVIRFVGDGASKAGLIARAAAEGIRNVRFDDALPKNQVGEMLHISDAFILNNRRDGASRNWMSFNKVYEYLAAGRPVIFGSYTSNDPVRESGAGISVDADDARALADGILFLAQCSREQLLAYGELGRRYVEDDYSIVSLVDRFEVMAIEVTGSAAMLPYVSAVNRY